MRFVLIQLIAITAMLCQASSANSQSLETTTKICMRLAQQGNYVKARKHCHEAADAGVMEAQYALGVMYFNGIRTYGMGNVSYPDLAYHYLSLAAGQGHMKSTLYLGYMYEDGHHVDKDLEAAAELYRQAAEGGDAEAQSKLGNVYAVGAGVERDQTIAINWYEKAAAQGDATAAFNLGQRYAQGRNVPQNHPRAVQLYRVGADQGVPVSQALLGFHYLIGSGVEHDSKQAFELSKAAAEADERFAQSNLGYMYLMGIGTRVREKRGYRMFGAAASNQTSPVSRLTYMYQTYDRTETMPELGYAWTIVASETDDSDTDSVRTDVAEYEESLDAEQLERGQRIAATILEEIR